MRYPDRSLATMLLPRLWRKIAWKPPENLRDQKLAVILNPVRNLKIGFHRRLHTLLAHLRKQIILEQFKQLWKNGIN